MRNSECYRILGIDQNTTTNDMRIAYYKKARECHPDKFPGNKAKEEEFKRLSCAYEQLCKVTNRDPNFDPNPQFTSASVPTTSVQRSFIVIPAQKATFTGLEDNYKTAKNLLTGKNTPTGAKVIGSLAGIEAMLAFMNEPFGSSTAFGKPMVIIELDVSKAEAEAMLNEKKGIAPAPAAPSALSVEVGNVHERLLSHTTGVSIRVDQSDFNDPQNAIEFLEAFDDEHPFVEKRLEETFNQGSNFMALTHQDLLDKEKVNICYNAPNLSELQKQPPKPKTKEPGSFSGFFGFGKRAEPKPASQSPPLALPASPPAPSAQPASSARPAPPSLVASSGLSQSSKPTQKEAREALRKHREEKLQANVNENRLSLQFKEKMQGLPERIHREDYEENEGALKYVDRINRQLIALRADPPHGLDLETNYLLRLQILMQDTKALAVVVKTPEAAMNVQALKSSIETVTQEVRDLLPESSPASSSYRPSI